MRAVREREDARCNLVDGDCPGVHIGSIVGRPLLQDFRRQVLQSAHLRVTCNQVSSCTAVIACSGSWTDIRREAGEKALRAHLSMPFRPSCPVAHPKSVGDSTRWRLWKPPVGWAPFNKLRLSACSSARAAAYSAMLKSVSFRLPTSSALHDVAFNGRTKHS